MAIHLTSSDVRSVTHQGDATGEAVFDKSQNRIMAVCNEGDFDAAIAALTELREHVAAGGDTSGKF